MNNSDWCDWHEGPSGTALAVRRIERHSASPVVHYACQPCREQRHLEPVDTVEDLARIRMHSTGETFEQACAVLRGQPKPPAPDATVVQLRPADSP